MAFCFKRRESVSKAIGRLGRDRIENALECLEDCSRVEAIHCARKDIKKVRAVLRLVRTTVRKKKCRRLIKLLREAADRLAPAREAYVNAKTLRDLAHHFQGQLSPNALRHLRSQLRSSSEEQMRRFGKERTAGGVQRTLRRVARKLDRLDVKGKGWAALNPGVKSAYKEGQRAYQAALKDSSPENFHEWRKRAKDLWYEVTLLRPVWPEQMDAMASELDGLTENLGDDHDLAVLREAVEKQCSGDGHGRELETLNALIEQRRGELRSAALALGRRFYSEKPSAFCSRLAGYWCTWRREKKSGTREAHATRCA